MRWRGVISIKRGIQVRQQKPYRFTASETEANWQAGLQAGLHPPDLAATYRLQHKLTWVPGEGRRGDVNSSGVADRFMGYREKKRKRCCRRVACVSLDRGTRLNTRFISEWR